MMRMRKCFSTASLDPIQHPQFSVSFAILFDAHGQVSYHLFPLMPGIEITLMVRSSQCACPIPVEELP